MSSEIGFTRAVIWLLTLHTRLSAQGIYILPNPVVILSSSRAGVVAKDSNFLFLILVDKGGHVACHLSFVGRSQHATRSTNHRSFRGR